MSATPLLVGSMVQLAAVTRDASGAALTGRAIDWSSSDTMIARVGSTGTVTGVGAGVAMIRATSEHAAASTALDFRVGGALSTDGGMITVMGGAVSITVPAGALTQSSTIMVSPAASVPADTRLTDGRAYIIGPTALSFTRPATLNLRYDRSRLPAGQSEASLLVGVLNGGSWAPVAGSTVDAVAGTVSGAITGAGEYAVLSAAVDHVTLAGAPASGSLYVGQSAQLSAMPVDANGNALASRAAAWTSSSGALSVSSSGRVTAVAPGSATVTVTIEGKSASTAITVAQVPVSAVALTPLNAALYAGHGLQLTAVAKDSAGGILTGRPITWTTGNSGVATVDVTGLVTGVVAGSASITAASGTASTSVTVTVLPAVVADWSQVAEWTTFQGNASHDGFVAATVDPTKLNLAWNKAVYPGVVLNPVTAGDGNIAVSTNAYFGTQGLSVLEATTGGVRWSYNFGGIHSVDPPAYANGTVYVQTGGHGDSYLWGFEAATGVIHMRTTYQNQWSRYYAPTIVGQSVYVAGGYYGGAYAFSATDGSQSWFATLSQFDQFTPAVRNGTAYVYVGPSPGKLSALNASTGAVQYEIADPGFGFTTYSMDTAPVLDDANHLFAIQGNRLLAFDLSTKTLAWQVSSQFVGNVTTAAGMLYVVDGGQVEARRASDGATQWLWVPPEGRVTGTTVVTRNLLFVSTSAATYALDLASHRQVWSYPAGGQLALTAAGQLLIAQANGQLTALTAR